MATGKVRIFELAKEVGLSSKELVALFNERLGGIFEAKNQLSVVPDQIADLVRSVLLKSAAAAKRRTRAAPAPKPAAPAAPARKRGRGAPARSRSADSSPASRHRRADPYGRAGGRPGARPARQWLRPPAPARAARAGRRRPRAPPPRRPAAKPAPEAIPQLRPVPSGQSSVARRAAPPPPTTSASASPGPAVGLPGRPGVAPRPGQAMPGQIGKAPGNLRPSPQAPAAGAPARRHAGNGPFRPLGPAQRPGPHAGPMVTPGDGPRPLGGRPSRRPYSLARRQGCGEKRSREGTAARERAATQEEGRSRRPRVCRARSRRSRFPISSRCRNSQRR